MNILKKFIIVSSVLTIIAFSHTNVFAQTPNEFKQPPVLLLGYYPGQYFETTVGEFVDYLVAAYDPNFNDLLSLGAQNLPPGLKVRDCIRTKDNISNYAGVHCYVTGIPYTAGEYNVKFTAKDNTGLSDTEFMRFVIRPKTYSQ